MKTLIKGAKIVTEKGLTRADILIEKGIISEISEEIRAEADRIIEGDGLTAIPGLVDMHTHLREPGYEYKENILTGTKAAVKGGFTSVACMPNTLPICDNDSVVNYIVDKAKEAGYAKVYPIGAITKGSQGVELSEMHRMKKAGIVAVSDDGRPVMNSNVMRHAMEYAKSVDILVISHCEDLELSKDGYVNEGYNSTISGLQGITRASEEIMVAREILLANALDTRIHIAHISTKGSVELVRQAKKKGVKVTAETCPHYFAATDDLILTFDSFTKVNPPLREEKDRLAIIEGLKDGTIDVIATDHAPHHLDEKRVEYALAANGISGLETAFSLAYTYLVKAGHIEMAELINLMCIKPAELIGIKSGLTEGNPADIVLVDLKDKYIIDNKKFLSRGKNTPFNGYEVYGNIVYTIIDGQVKLDKGQIV